MLVAGLDLSILSTRDPELEAELRRRIDGKTKPQGSLGRLEELAVQLGLIQRSVAPRLERGTLVVFAGDHGIASEGVSAYPQDVTRQMVLNFMAGGAAANVLAREAGLAFLVVDAGVAGEALPEGACLVPAKVGPGTRSFATGPAMSADACAEAVRRGVALAERLSDAGSEALVLGEMGIGNTSSAACLMAVLGDEPVEACVGRGTGLTDAALARKRAVLAGAVASYRGEGALAALAHFGGFEIAMMTGAFLGGAARRRVLLVDGFIATAALLVAARLAPAVLDYCVFAHCSEEQAHARLLDLLQARPLLDLGLRLGEGTGAALAFPLVRSAASILRDMASFASAGVSGRAGEDA